MTMSSGPTRTTAGAPGAPSTRPVVIANPASGGAIDEAALRAAFADRDVVWSPTTEDDPGLGQAAAAVEDGSPLVIACGGDGTVRAVIESVAGTTTALGIVPLGTGNLLASNLGLATGLDAVGDAFDGPVRRLDVGHVNGERFAVMAGVGFDAMMIRDASATVKRRFGSIAYVVSAARNIPARLTRASLSIDGDVVWHGRTVMVLVGNCGQVTGGLEVFPDARPDDGVLDVAVLSAKRFTEWCSVMWRLLWARPQRSELVARFQGADINIALHERLPYELDGEDRQPTKELCFGVEALSLAVRGRGDQDGGT